MAIKNIVLRGFGNGTVIGTIAAVVTRGYRIVIGGSGTRRQRALAAFTRRKR